MGIFVGTATQWARTAGESQEPVESLGSSHLELPPGLGRHSFPVPKGHCTLIWKKKIRMSIKVIKLAHQSDILDISKYYHIPYYTVLISHHFLFLGIRQHINTLYYGMVLF